MAFLLALLLAFGRLSSDSEITAVKACGVSLYGLLPPVLVFALLTYLATTFITVFALPWGNTSFKRLLFDIVESRITLSLKEKVFNDDFPGLVIYTDLLDSKRHVMSGILINDDRNPQESSTIFADSGIIVTDRATKTLRLELKNGGIHRLLGKTGYRLIEFQDYVLSIDLSRAPREMVKNELDMTFTELREGIHSPRIEPKLRRDMRLEFHRRFSLPFACFVFALAGVPLGIQNQRSGKAAGFSLSIGVLLTYYIILSAGKTLGEREVLHPAAAVWAPNLFFLAFGIYLFRMTAAEQRILLFEIIPGAVKWVRTWLDRRRERR
jgi:lipopolysaccharide export system permease protein